MAVVFEAVDTVMRRTVALKMLKDEITNDPAAVKRFATFGPLVLFSLFWKRTNRAGAIAGMLGGGIMVFFWKLVIRPLGGAWNIYELLPAFLFSCALIIIVSLVTAPPSDEIQAEFDEVKMKKS